MRFVAALVGVSCGALLLAGCAVGPNYKRPAVNAPENFRNAPGVLSTNSLADLHWWELYHDQALSSLLRTALTNNYDLRIAMTRVEQAAAVAAQARAQFVPHAGYKGVISRGRNEFLGMPNGESTTGDTVFAALNASWEVDLWGRIRRLNESARASLVATEEGRRSVRLSLVASVAQAYFELLELDRRLQIAHRATASFKESARIFNERFEAGGGTRLDTSRAEGALAISAADVPDLERQITLKENQISVLLGCNPGPIVHTASLHEQVFPPEVPAGLPSRLLERRPDISQAEQELRSANAQIGVSVAEFFPKIGITTFMGKLSPELSALSAGGANAWAVASSLIGPIFQGGALVGQYRQAKAKREEARLRYEQTALNAFQEVAAALVAREKLEAVRVEQARAVKNYEQAVQLSSIRYTEGRATYFELLDAQQLLFPAENALARTELNQLLVVVQFYKALGGGWEEAK